jgi:uncharacterized protein YkwD
MGGMHIRLLGLVAGLVAVLGTGTLAAGSAAAATQFPRTALLMRINAVRVNHGLRPVAPAASLRDAARRHSSDMLARDYFSHVSPSGSTLFLRIERSGFVAGHSWVAGETLAWGTSALSTPAATVRAWLASPEHRPIVLSPTYTRIGISRECGRFLGHVGACVWTADWVKRW